MSPSLSLLMLQMHLGPNIAVKAFLSLAARAKNRAALTQFDFF